MVCPASGLGDDMVNLEYLEGEVHLATGAYPFLLAVEDVLVLPVMPGNVYVCPLGIVGPYSDLSVME